MIIRPYAAADRARCLAMFQANMPTYFAPHEQAEFDQFLAQTTDDYFVVEHDGQILGCGGFYTAGEGGGLCWGMVDPAWHGRHVGWMLLITRLKQLCERGVGSVRLDTSQHTHGFFAKAGFVITSITRDGYAPGLHRYDMVLALDEARCAWLRELPTRARDT